MRSAGLRLAICTDTYAPHLNGVARTLERLAAAVEARGGEARVLTVADPDAPHDLRVSRVASVPFWKYQQLRVAPPSVGAARRLFTEFRPTLVHAATPFGIGLGARAAAKQMGIRLVTSYHTHFTAYLKHYKLSALNAVSWPFLRWFHNSGLATYAPSESVRVELVRRGFSHTRVWSRGIDATRFNPRFRSAELRQSLGVGPNQLLVLYVGRIAPEKGIDAAIAGVARAMALVPGRITLALTGDGPSEQRAREMAPPGTVFTGPLAGDALSTMYASADIFVFPSLTETFGNVVIEAMASGLAVVAPDRGPTTEFAHADVALVCNVTNPDAIAASVARLATDVSLRMHLTSAALTAARARTWDSIFDRLLADYAALPARGRNAAEEKIVLSRNHP